MIKFSLPLLLCLCSIASQASGLAVVKLNGQAARGECLAPRIDPANDILRTEQIKVTGAQPEQLQALKKVIHAISHIGDGSFQYHKGAHYRFINDGRRASNYDGIRLNIRPGNQNRTGLSAGLDPHAEAHRIQKYRTGSGQSNHALLVHELGHYIGHKTPKGTLKRKGPTVYTAYKNSVKKCGVSGYAVNDRVKRHEEFAEAFTAYVTNPQMLIEKPGCTEVVAFFSELFGERTPAQTCQARIASLRAKSTTMQAANLNDTKPSARGISGATGGGSVTGAGDRTGVTGGGTVTDVTGADDVTGVASGG